MNEMKNVSKEGKNIELDIHRGFYVFHTGHFTLINNAAKQ